MTLAEVIPAARRLTAIEKLKLIQVLVEDLTWILLKILHQSNHLKPMICRPLTICLVLAQS